MTFINYASREINCKIVYYGPGLCGKTTNLQYIFDSTAPQARGKLISLATETDQLAARLGRGRIKDVLQVSRLTTQTWAVVDDLAVDFSRSVIDEGHSVPLAEKTVDVLVGNAGEGRIEVVVVSVGNFFEHCRQLMRNLLTAEFH